MIRKVKGTRDVLPPDSSLWGAVESVARRIFAGFGYDEIRLPIMEPTELFVRSVGEGTDIVSKEMYSFEDRKGRLLTLRPEGTAGVARAYIENSLGQRPQPIRLSYLGPMFRYEKMQRGRYRQFSQIGIELLGAATPQADVEVLLALHTFLSVLGFDDLTIVLNNLGDPEDRDRFITVLKSELREHFDELCDDCRRRWRENPMRILDCKVKRCQHLVTDTTPISEIANEEATAHVEKVAAGLDSLRIPVRRAPRLVRGLDYYLRTVFEVISPALGENTVICGGGRYDRLIADLGGAAVPGIGFAIGTDRLVDVLPDAYKSEVLGRPRIAVVPLGEEAAVAALSMTRELVRAGYDAPAEVTGRSLKAGLKWANKTKAAVAVIIGETEIEQHTVIVRNLLEGTQETVARDSLVEQVRREIGNS